MHSVYASYSQYKLKYFLEYFAHFFIFNLVLEMSRFQILMKSKLSLVFHYCFCFQCIGLNLLPVDAHEDSLSPNCSRV